MSNTSRAPSETPPTLTHDSGAPGGAFVSSRRCPSSAFAPTEDGAYCPLASVPPPGTLLAGKYRIERVLGTGAMGVVAAAHHVQLDVRVAIKYLLPEAFEYPELVERFSREARIAARIQSEHVARVIDVGVLETGLPFIVLEYLQGEDLATHLEAHGRLDINVATRYVLELCEALAETHAANVVHRDLKPANIFVAKLPDRRRIVKVLDFGISKIMDESLTSPTRMLGTAPYMSPEQLRSSRLVDHRSDIWAVGVILYELLTGEVPFRGRNLMEVVESVKANMPIPVRELCPAIPIGLADVVSRCLQSAPEDRFPTVLELAVALAPFAKSRDRASIRTISGVLCGSIAPPPCGDSSSSSGNVDALAILGPLRNEMRQARAPRAVQEIAGGREVPGSPEIGEMRTMRDARIARDRRDTPEFLATQATGSLPNLGADRETDIPVTTVTSKTLADPIERKRVIATIAIGLAAALLLLFSAGRSVLPARAGTASATATTTRDAARTVALRVAAKPSQARVRIDDGAPMPLPVEQNVVRDDREHRIVIEADGYISHVEVVRFTSDLTVSMALAHLPTPAPARAAAKGHR